MKSTPSVMSASPSVFKHGYRAGVNETLRHNSNWMPDSILQHWEPHEFATREQDVVSVSAHRHFQSSRLEHVRVRLSVGLAGSINLLRFRYFFARRGTQKRPLARHDIALGREQLRNNHIRMESAGLITPNEITC